MNGYVNIEWMNEYKMNEYANKYSQQSKKKKFV